MDEDLEDDMEEADEGLVLDCPTCGELQPHELLRAATAGWTVECLECHTVRTLPAPRKERTVSVPVILSQGATARTTKVEVPLDGDVRPDDEFELDGSRIRVTAVETPDGQRPKKALGRDIKTLYAVVFDTVTLHYTLNEGDVTRSFREQVEPEEEIHIGTVREVAGVRLAIKTLKSDQNRTLHRGFLMARNVVRVFADVANPRAKAGQKHRVRSRGAPPGVSKAQGPRNRDKKPRGAGPRRS